MLESPIVTSLFTVAELRAASCPIQILLSPDEIVDPALVPTKVLSCPVVRPYPAVNPIPTL